MKRRMSKEALRLMIVSSLAICSVLTAVLVWKIRKVEAGDNYIIAYACMAGNTLYITSADYFEETGCLDDGSSDDYGVICKAAREIGLSEERESIFTVNGASAATVAEMLNERGVRLCDNEAFSKLCLR